MLVPFVYACKKELSAAEYLVTHQVEVENLNELFQKSRGYLAKDEIEKAETIRVELFQESNQSLKKIEKLQAFEEEEFLKTETLSLIRFYKDLSSSEHKELVQILRKKDLELIDDVRVAYLNKSFDRMYAQKNHTWTQAKMQFERMYKVRIP